MKGVRIERLTFDEQLKTRVDRLKNDEGLARSEGIREEDLFRNWKSVRS